MRRDADEHSGGAERKIVTPKRGKDGLFVQPHDFSADRETAEQHNRDRFAAHFKYADPFTGLTRTYHAEGNYNCGDCNMADEAVCLLVHGSKPSEGLVIDLEAGSCGDWEDRDAGDFEIPLFLKSVSLSLYGIAKNGVGFGCWRCPFASQAYQPDSQGRSLYCGKGDMRVFERACCMINGAPTKADNRATRLYTKTKH